MIQRLKFIPADSDDFSHFLTTKFEPHNFESCFKRARLKDSKVENLILADLNVCPVFVLNNSMVEQSFPKMVLRSSVSISSGNLVTKTDISVGFEIELVEAAPEGWPLVIC